MLIPVPECGACFLLKSLVFIADASTELDPEVGRQGLRFDAMISPCGEDGQEDVCFYLEGRLCYKIPDDALRIVLPKEEPPIPIEAEPVFVVYARLEPDGRLDAYLSDDTTLQPGEAVVVDEWNGPCVATVVHCGMRSPEALAWPLARYKKILGRAQ